MGKTRSQVGFWTSVRHLKTHEIVTLESVAAVVLGVGMAVGLAIAGTMSDRVSIAPNFLVVVGTLVGIVFAGLALVTSLLSRDYLRLLQSSTDGVLAFFRPFMIAVGIQVSTVVSSLLYIAFAKILPTAVEPWGFGIVAVLFFLSCFEVVALTRTVLLHALLRARFSEVVQAEVDRPK